MDNQHSAYCGLCCENCAVRVHIYPAALALQTEMQRAGFDQVVHAIPGGAEFWGFLGGMVQSGVCPSCRAGGGNPGCRVRVCAREKGVEMCALCASYPCALTETFDAGYPMLKTDNALLRDAGWQAWSDLQDARRAEGYTYQDENL
ncbi:MAG: DUF3795 domain-containing protein [Clostridiales bacterium]|nr:DUF3795 domain-containing protein [Clostridiales bacterium]